ncbi:MAG TPA: hypothetical protein VIV37_04655 [Gaiellaceae bacterium]
MTPKIALIIGIAATALAFGVPTGLAERQLVGLAEPDGVAYFYANERATLAQQSDSPARHSDSSETAAFLANERATLQATAPDWFERAAAVAVQKSARARHSDSSETAAFLANERATLVGQGSGSVVSDPVQLDPNEASPTVSVSSGSEIEWSQLGIGFGLGILLIAGLWLAMRMTKGRPLAH